MSVIQSVHNNALFSKNYMPNGCALYNAKLPDEASATTVLQPDTAQVVPWDLWPPSHNLKNIQGVPQNIQSK